MILTICQPTSLYVDCSLIPYGYILLPFWKNPTFIPWWIPQHHPSAYLDHCLSHSLNPIFNQENWIVTIVFCQLRLQGFLSVPVSTKSSLAPLIRDHRLILIIDIFIQHPSMGLFRNNFHFKANIQLHNNLIMSVWVIFPPPIYSLNAVLGKYL